MKNIKLFLSLAALVLLSAVSCTSSEPDSNTSKSYTISDFSSLNLEIIGQVYYEQSDSVYLNVSGSSNLIEALTVSDKKGKLSVDLKTKHKYSGGKNQLTIRVGSPQLKSINFQSVGTLHLKNNFEGDRLSITNKGVGEIIIDDCHVNTFSLTTKSVGSIEVKGSANTAVIDSEGIGKIDFSEFKSKKAKVTSKGAGDLSVYASESINISMKGIGNVSYYGNPSDVKTDISGLGKVTRKD